MRIVGDNSTAGLKNLVERIERLESEKAALVDDIKQVFAESKGAGFDTKIMRLLIKERKRDADDLTEERSLLETYRRALGDLAETPLGAAAMARIGG